MKEDISIPMQEEVELDNIALFSDPILTKL
jgi:hypothetical protein